MPGGRERLKPETCRSPFRHLPRAEFVADVTGAMQLAAASEKIVITDDGTPAWVLLDIDVFRRLIAGATGLLPKDARPQRTLDDYLHILR